MNPEHVCFFAHVKFLILDIKFNHYRHKILAASAKSTNITNSQAILIGCQPKNTTRVKFIHDFK